jgi:hypothetical protein
VRRPLILHASAFTAARDLITCTLLGTVSQHHIELDAPGDLVKIETVWAEGVKSLAKVNTLAVDGHWIAIGGFGTDGRGVIEIWSRAEQQSTANPAH